MADGFWTPQCVEAAAQIAHEAWCDNCLACTGPSDDDEAQGEAALDAALAAKDREEMIEAAAHAIPVGAILYRRRVASAVLAALGLLASPDEEH